MREDGIARNQSLVVAVLFELIAGHFNYATVCKVLSEGHNRVAEVGEVRGLTSNAVALGISTD